MASSFYLSVKGARQGDFKGEADKNQTAIPILGFSYGVTVLRDASGGMPTGRRQHKPVSIYKEWGVASVQLFEALVTNENLISVVIQEMRTDKTGKEEIYMQIHLSNATISAIQIDPQRQENPPIWTNNEIERVDFTFARIEIENVVSKTTAIDDWQAHA